MKIIIFILTALFTVPTFAQIYFGTSHQYIEAKIFKKINDNYHNNILTRDPDIGYRQCQKDHAIILDIVKQKNKVHIAKLVERINDLSRSNHYEGYVKSFLRNQLLAKLMNYIVLSEMKKELNRKNIKQAVWDEYDQNPKTNTKIFEMKYHGIDIEGYFDEALNAAAKYKSHNRIPTWLLLEIRSSLISGMLSQLKANSFNVIINGVAIQFLSKIIKGTITKEIFQAGLKKSIISFTSKTLVSAGQGLLLDLLTIPLKGQRLPPESLWLDLLNDYPGIILNPELMRSAGIDDNAWSAHCNTINRRAQSIEKILTKLETSLDKEFMKIQTAVTDMLDTSRYGSKYQVRAKIDNTYVAPRPDLRIR